MITKESDIYFTPDWIKTIFDNWFDPCQLSNGELREFDGLGEWKDKTFVNPPYSNPLPWVEKAIEESRKGKMIIMLLNIDSSTKWYRKLVEADAHFIWFAERLSFSNVGKGTKPSMLVVLKNEDTKQKTLFAKEKENEK